ncbi:MAG: hypothetical protein AVDCRST_MAG04-870, partial [uncultured Acetobacteraceae bacterium]
GSRFRSAARFRCGFFAGHNRGDLPHDLRADPLDAGPHGRWANPPGAPPRRRAPRQRPAHRPRTGARPARPARRTGRHHAGAAAKGGAGAL